MLAIPPRSCQGTTKAGGPCRTTLNIGASGYCLWHDEAREAERRAVREAGGVARGAARRLAKAVLPEDCPRAPHTIADAEAFASWLTYAVTTGAIDARVAHEAAVCLREFRLVAEKRIMEREIKGLRADLAAAKRTQAGRVG